MQSAHFALFTIKSLKFITHCFMWGKALLKSLQDNDYSLTSLQAASMSSCYKPALMQTLLQTPMLLDPHLRQIPISSSWLNLPPWQRADSGTVVWLDECATINSLLCFKLSIGVRRCTSIHFSAQLSLAGRYIYQNQYIWWKNYTDSVIPNKRNYPMYYGIKTLYSCMSERKQNI